MLAGGKYTEIWSIETGGIEKATEHNSKVSSALWIDDNKTISGYEDGKIATVNVTTGDILKIMDCHKYRVKTMAINNSHLITGCSSGEIKVWDLDEFKCLSRFESGCRITCLSVSNALAVKKEEIKDEELAEPNTNASKSK